MQQTAKRRSNFALFILTPLVALLASCATSYQKEGFFTNGYSDRKVTSDIFDVTFRANEQTPSEKVLRYAMKRAAELTLKNGYRYFAVIEEIDTSQIGYRPKAHLHYPSIRLKIQCFHEKPLDRDAIDALRF